MIIWKKERLAANAEIGNDQLQCHLEQGHSHSYICLPITSHPMSAETGVSLTFIILPTKGRSRNYLLNLTWAVGNKLL